jgi:hypothetical protein
MILKASSHLQVKILVTSTTLHKVGSVRIGVRYHPILQKQCLHKQLVSARAAIEKKLEKSCLVFVQDSQPANLLKISLQIQQVHNMPSTLLLIQYSSSFLTEGKFSLNEGGNLCRNHFKRRKR